MSEEEKKDKLEVEQGTEQSTENPEEVKEDSKEEVTKETSEKGEEKKKSIKLSKFADIFITESDTFDITVDYYKKGDELMVSDIDDAFDPKDECDSFTATFKYPDQGDYTAISSQAQVGSLGASGLDNLDIRDYLTLEFSRVLCLIRKWSIDQDLTNQNIMKLHPKIVKSMLAQVRNKIGTDGII